MKSCPNVEIGAKSLISNQYLKLSEKKVVKGWINHIDRTRKWPKSEIRFRKISSSSVIQDYRNRINIEHD